MLFWFSKENLKQCWARVERKKILHLRIDNKASQRNLNDPIMVMVWKHESIGRRKTCKTSFVDYGSEQRAEKEKNIKLKLKHPLVIISLAFAGVALCSLHEGLCIQLHCIDDDDYDEFTENTSSVFLWLSCWWERRNKFQSWTLRSERKVL